MTSHDDEFDDFLRRRRPVFRTDDDLEPPAELDRLVLSRARDAIERDRPQRVFRAPAWGMPVALAATLVLAFTVILRVGTHEVARTPEVTVQNVSRQVEMPAAPGPAEPEMARAAAPAEAPAAPERESDGGAIVVDLGARAASGTAADSAAAPPPQPRARRLEKMADAAQPARDSASGTLAEQQSSMPASASAAAAEKPDYRRDSKRWLAEIERLRAAGDDARAAAELAEYKREHRAYAGAPDR
jgi:hypothetical protein